MHQHLDMEKPHLFESLKRAFHHLESGEIKGWLITCNNELHKSLLLDRIDVPISLIDFIANSIEICGNLIATEAVDKHETCYTAR